MSEKMMRKQNQLQDGVEVCDLGCPLSDGCSDRFRIIRNVYLGLQDDNVERFFDQAARKHWRKTDKAIVFGYQPGGCFDFVFGRDLDRIIKPESSWVRASILGSRLKIAYEEERTFLVNETQIAYGQVYFYATNENGNYRDIMQEEIPVLFDFILDNYAKITFHGEQIEALVL